MGRRGKFSVQKRMREKVKHEKRQEKAERRSLRKEEREAMAEEEYEGDPDLAGIVPGPQPPWDPDAQ